MSSSDSDSCKESWEEHSVDSESLSEGESGRTSDKDDDDFDEDIEVVHGAEP